MSQTINITPNPRILEVITRNPMHPTNAICELIDNGIDSFGKASDLGTPILNPAIDIYLPSKSEIDSGIGRIVVRDNGIGLSKEEANNAIRAGYSGNEQIGRMGLFGMGFNISTGKLGKKTILRTARKEDSKMLAITIDIPALVKGGSFDVPIEELPKPYKDFSGVEVEIRDWWDEGHDNYGFAKKLVSVGVPDLLRQIARRYAARIRKDLVIKINDRACPVFHHCYWGENRFVERREHGRIPAKYNFDQLLRVETRCFSCGDLLAHGKTVCPKCGKKSQVKSRECRIRGWVGIQRYDSMSDYGIDFIRNGRAILISEQDAIFTWTPIKTGQRINEYPSDGIYGRIIGEVMIDHVPTDFLKTDFQRSSAEWAEVIKFLRGNTCLYPEKRREFGEVEENHSPIYMLFQGYRKVRAFGKGDMYMGYWKPGSDDPDRITREEEKELIKKFENNEPGYGPKDDSGWWALVERADIRPTPNMKDCPDCGCQCSEGADRCTCGHIFSAKKCVHSDCGKDIATSDMHCPFCGTSQVPEEEEQWICGCMKRNPPDAFKCRRCGTPRGAADVFKLDYLKENSVVMSELCKDSLSIALPDGVTMAPLKLLVYIVNLQIKLQRGDFRVPSVVHSTANEMCLFIDQKHPIYEKYQDRWEDIISIEVARWIWHNNQGRITDSNRVLWSLSNLYYLIHSRVWGNRVELSTENIIREVGEFFNSLKEVLPDLLKQEAESVYDNLEDFEQSRVVDQLFRNGLLSRKDELIKNGEYLSFLPLDLVIDVLKKYPKSFFDGKFWNDPYDKFELSDLEILGKIQKETLGKYSRCLEDMFYFTQTREPGINYIRKISQTLRMVNENLAKK